MAYATTNPPIKLTMGPLAEFNTTENTNPGGAIWLYKSADPIATVQGAGYISDGVQRGMQIDDIVFVFDTNLAKMYPSFVVSRTVTNAFAGQGSVTLNSTTTLTAA
jgi:hypothetical protein